VAKRTVEPPHVTAVPFTDRFVKTLVEDVARRLGQPLPWTLPKVYLAPDIDKVWPGYLGAFVPPATIYVKRRDEALIRYELGRWFCHVAGYSGSGRRAAAWARRAEGHPLWVLGYLFG
jgi:hypothetical protein